MGVTPQETVVGQPAASACRVATAYEGYAFSGLAPGIHQGLPSGSLTFIVSLAEEIDIQRMPGNDAPRSFQAFVAGLHAFPATIVHNGSGRGVSFNISPITCRGVFGMPAAELASRVVDVSDLLGHLGVELVERLLDAPDWRRRFDVLDGALARMETETSRPDMSLVAAWNLLLASRGTLTTSELAREVGYSRRHLTQRFVAEFGLAPKTVARVLRFEHTRSLIENGCALAEAATRGGYYDQAHLTNEWRGLAGMTPAVWKAAELRDRQLGLAEVP